MKELTGKGSPFHSALDKAASLLKRNVGTGMEFMQELGKIPGVKKEEIEDRKLHEITGMPKMTREKFLSELQNRPVPQIREKELGINQKALNEHARELAYKDARDFLRQEGFRGDVLDDMADNMADENVSQFIAEAHDELVNKYKHEFPWHEQHTLPGGENYREMLIKAPKEKRYWAQKFSGAETKFFDDPDEASEYAGNTGQAGQVKNAPEQFPGSPGHFGGEPGILASMRVKDRTGPNGEKLLHLEELQSDWHQKGREGGYGSQLTPEDAKRIEQLRQISANSGMSMDERAEFDSLIKKREGAVPDAPFKKNWEEMALKRLIHHAAENGYHGIVVTPGAEQADRYSLAKHIDALHYNPDTHRLIGKKNGRMLIDEVAVPPEKLESYVGKDTAKKVMEQEPNVNGLRSLIGEELVVGGEGMKGFYDKKVPNILNSIGKKYGVKTQLGGHAIDVPDMINVGAGAQAEVGRKQSQLHHFPITEEMRKDIRENGLPLYAEGGEVHMADGGSIGENGDAPIPSPKQGVKVNPSIAQMKLALATKGNPLSVQSIGANEAPSMSPKTYLPPDTQQGQYVPPGGAATPSGMPVGGIDMNSMQPGNQLMPGGLQPPQPQQPQQGPQAGPQQAPQPGQPQQPQGGGNILQMTPQGRAMAAISPNPPQGMAKGGEVDDKKSTRVTINAEGPGGVKGIVVPRHMLEGNPKSGVEGMNEVNKARAKVYGAEAREPLTLSKMASIHKKTLQEHFAKPVEQQVKDEVEALQRLRAAKHIGKSANTLDESEKLDTVRHETDEEGRTHVGYAAKGVAGHALYTSGAGKNAKHHILNTCPGQTEGCGGGTDEKGIVDTKRGTCFAPNAESQYPAASVRRASHAQAKHDPAMTNDWILAHTGSLRHAANMADKKNQRTLFRPNVVDETDVSSRHVLRHLNEQRSAEGKPPIIANSYGKTNELHDPENGYYVTHSNVGPKVKHGREVSENIGRDKARVRNTILAADNRGDFKNEQGNKTPPKGSYMVTDVKRGSPLSKEMEKHITHAKYWSTGREEHELSPEEKAEGPEGHFGPKGSSTTPEKAHYGHTTVNGRRYDYQKQHILHPRLVQVGENKDGTPHMIPTDSRFKDTEFLPKNRFKTKNGKEAGHILMTTPTESTSNLGHHTPFTHNVSEKHIEHAKKNKGEYEIDSPMEQEKARGKEYVAPKPISIVKKAVGGSIGRHRGYSEDDFHAFPESNVAAQRHLALRRGDDEDRVQSRAKKSVPIHKSIDTMRLEMMRK